MRFRTHPSRCYVVLIMLALYNEKLLRVRKKYGFEP